MRFDARCVVVIAGFALGCGPAVRSPTTDAAGFEKLEVSPLWLNFGVEMVGHSATQQITATNVGAVPVELTIDPVGAPYELSTTGPVDVQPGESVEIAVTHAPTQASIADDAQVVFHWRDGNVQVGLTGSAADALPCSLMVQPSNYIDFGDVKPGTAQTATLTLTDVGSGDCIVRGVHFGVGTDPAFTLTDGLITSQVLSPPGTSANPSSLVVPVSFFPPQTGEYDGSLDFTVDGEQAPWSIPVTGLGSLSGCLIAMPAGLNFGTVSLDPCGTFPDRKRFVVVNGCEFGEVLSVTLSGDAFELFETPPLPLSVPAGQVSPLFVVAFTPPDAGTFGGSVVVETTSGQLGVGLNGNAIAPAPPETDSFNYTFDGSYVIALGAEGADLRFSVLLNGTALPSADWSYDPQTGDLTIDQSLVTLHDGDVLTVVVQYVLVCD